MQMGPKEIARDYRTAANKMKQIVILAELNQCAERRIAEILDAEGEELPKKWQVQLQKPARRSRKFPEGEATPEDDAPAPVSPADRATDRDLFEAVATLLPDGSREEAAPEAMPTAAPEKTATVTLDPSVWDRAVERKIEPGEIHAETLLPKAERQRPGENGVPVAPRNKDEARHWVDGVGPVYASDRRRCTVRVSISTEELLREACQMLTSALDLAPDQYHTYSCGVLDLVHALTEEEV